MKRFVSGKGFVELRVSWLDPWNVSFGKWMPKKNHCHEQEDFVGEREVYPAKQGEDRNAKCQERLIGTTSRLEEGFSLFQN